MAFITCGGGDDSGGWTGAAPSHLRKALWAALVFVGCVTFDFIDSLIGAHWGNWPGPTLPN
jgi:hypothetical protein